MAAAKGNHRRHVKRPHKAWSNANYVRAYQLAREGLSTEQIAQVLGVDKVRLYKWMKDDPDFKGAIDEGRLPFTRRGQTNGHTLTDYVYNRLPPDLQRLWLEISECDNDQVNGIVKIEGLLDQGGKRVRQYLFFHALANCHFNVSEALRRINTPYNTLLSWKGEPEFLRLYDEFIWHYKEFCRGKLNELVAEKNQAAVIFVNKTINKDMGYTEKIEVEHKHDHQHTHLHAHISADDLPLELRKQVLQVLRDKKQQTPTPDIIDVDTNDSLQQLLSHDEDAE